jgi:hypothetical protein
MKRIVLLIILGLFLLWPFHLFSKHLYGKIAFGLFTGGNVDDVWQSTTGYYEFKAIKGAKSPSGLDVSLEFIYQLHPNISFSLGAEYFSKKVNGSIGWFTSPEASDFIGDFSYSPELDMEVYSVFLSAIYSFPVMTTVRLNFLGGVGFYFGRIECTEVNWRNETGDPRSRWNYFTWRYESDVNTVGFRSGIGVDIDVFPQMFLTLEALYRWGQFKSFHSCVAELYSRYGFESTELGEESTFLYAERILGTEEQGDIDYNVSDFSYSGFSFLVGFKFKF